MKALTDILSALVFVTISTSALAGDKNSFWVREQSALFQAGFSGTACSKLPTPGVMLDGQTNCIKAPQTYLYRKVDEEGRVTKEVRRLEDTYNEQCTRSIDANGNPVENCSVEVVSGPSADINFTRRQEFSIMGTTLGNGDSSSNNRGTTSIGLAAARRSTQEPVE